MPKTKTILELAVALMHDANQRVLLVRKTGTEAFMQPGGKIESGESARDCLVRELSEELDLKVEPVELRWLGAGSAVAANEPDTEVRAQIFLLELQDEFRLGAELVEHVWVDPLALPKINIAPLSRDTVLPMASKL